MGRAHAETSVPVATVLFPAAGSEMRERTVITNEDGELKKGYSDDLCRCKFAVDESGNGLLRFPSYRTACGVTDIMMHCPWNVISLMMTI